MMIVRSRRPYLVRLGSNDGVFAVFLGVTCLVLESLRLLLPLIFRFSIQSNRSFYTWEQAGSYSYTWFSVRLTARAGITGSDSQQIEYVTLRACPEYLACEMFVLSRIIPKDIRGALNGKVLYFSRQIQGDNLFLLRCRGRNLGF